MTKVEREHFTPIAKDHLASQLLNGKTLAAAYKETLDTLRSMQGGGTDQYRFSPVAVIDGLKGVETITVTIFRVSNEHLNPFPYGTVEIDFDNDTFVIVTPIKETL